MRVYHGSYVAVTNPDLIHSRENEDFWKGFYTTPIYEQDEKWLDFILQCHTCKDTTDYDIVIGGVANDRVFNTVELYFDGLIDKAEDIKRLMYEETNLQITFRTEKALSKLVFERSVEVWERIQYCYRKSMLEL